MAIERVYEVLADGLTVSGYLQQTMPETVPWGLDGSGAGAPAAVWIELADGCAEALASKFIGVTTNRGDRLFLRSAGGAGWARA